MFTCDKRLAIVLWLLAVVVFLYRVQNMSPQPTNPVKVPPDVTQSHEMPPDVTQSHEVPRDVTQSHGVARDVTTVPTYFVYFCNPYDAQDYSDYLDREEDKPVGHVYWKTVRGIDQGRTAFELALNNPRTDTYISGTIMRGQIWEPEVLGVVQTYVKGPESVFVDVGANIGYYSAMAATRGAKVHSVEAVWPNYARLAMTRKRMGDPSTWRIWRHAADMEEGRVVRLQVASRGRNAGNFKATTKLVSSGYPPSQHYATTIRLDQVVQEPVDLIKLDVEGQEAQVLAGATQLVCYHGVRAIVMEFTHDLRNNPQCEWRKMFQWLKKIGYNLYAANGVTPLDWRMSRWTYRGANVLWKRMRDRVQC